MGSCKKFIDSITMKCVAVLLSAVLTATGSPLVPMEYEGAATVDPDAIGNSAGNFKCNVNSIQLITDQAASPNVKDAFEPNIILNHFGKPQELEWAHISQHYFSDIDGRSTEKMLSTPGGDLGEFLLAVSVFEDTTKTEVDVETATGLLQSYLKSSTRSKFFFNTAEKELTNLTSTIGCGNLKLSDPPGMYKKALLKGMVSPGNVGNRHFKNMLAMPEAFETKAKTVGTVIQAFHLLMWNKTDSVHEKLTYALYKGAPKEKAFVNIESSQICLDEGLAPLISSSTCSANMFLNHPEAVIKMRLELAHLFAKKNNKVMAAELLNKMQKGVMQLAKTAAIMLKGYPVYTVKLDRK